jgi:hypothetical protein
MSELSPSAKTILAASAKANCLQEWDHVNDPPCHPDDSDWNGCYTCVHRAGIAAALRAAADQVVIKLGGLGQESAWYLEEIAAELEAQ